MEKKLKRSVLIITERYYPEKFLINDLVLDLVEKGILVSILTQVPSYPHDTLFPGYPNTTNTKIERGALVIRFKTVLGYKASLFRKILNYVVFMIRACFYIVENSRTVDAVFVYHTGPLTQALPLALVKAVTHKHTVIWTQDVWPDTVFAYGLPEKGSLAIVLKSFVRFVYKFADDIIVSSPGFTDRLQPYLGKDKKARFVPQWVPDEFFLGTDNKVALDGAGARFIFTGNVGSMQNLENVIRAFGRIDPACATLYILGDGTLRSALEQFVAEQKITNVHFLGSVNPSAVLSYIKACDFSVLSLKSDRIISLTIPAKFQTYLAAGRPIFVVAKGEVRSIVEREDIGLGVDPDDVAVIASGIQEAARSRAAERKKWADKMSDLLERDYSKQNAVGKIIAAIWRDKQ